MYIAGYYYACGSAPASGSPLIFSSLYRMARGTLGLFGLFLVVVVAVAVLPFVRNYFAPLFPEGFRTLDCKGMNCQEGEFCQDNKCHAISPPITNNYFKME
jgi:hypothetical protein